MASPAHPLPAHALLMTEEAWFALLENSDLKYEYWDGCAVAMAGAQPDHVRIEGNIFGELFQQLRGRNCLPLVSNQAVRLSASRGYVFPDVTVVCGKPEFTVRRGIGCLTNPTTVVEVLSPATASRDENEKLLAYTAIGTIREYLVVSTQVRSVKLYFRSAPDRLWSVRVYTQPDQCIELESCQCRLSLAEIYAGADPTGADAYTLNELPQPQVDFT